MSEYRIARLKLHTFSVSGSSLIGSCEFPYAIENVDEGTVILPDEKDTRSIARFLTKEPLPDKSADIIKEIAYTLAISMLRNRSSLLSMLPEGLFRDSFNENWDKEECQDENWKDIKLTAIAVYETIKKEFENE